MGGNGGRGADIILLADNNVRDLNYFRFNPRHVGKAGEQGGGNKRAGACAKATVIKVPVGTTIRHAEKGYLVRNLKEHGEEVVVVRGGGPGRGNKDNTPRTMGQPGEEFQVILDYVIPTDVIFVGLGNSGKSTVLSAITNAKVELHVQPFSTSGPQLGAYRREDYSNMILCDIPSVDLGLDDHNHFLKHVVGAKVLWYVVDKGNTFYSDVVEALQAIQEKLKSIDEEVVNKPYCVVVNKADMLENEDCDTIEKELRAAGHTMFMVSAKDKTGFDALMAWTEETVDAQIERLKECE